MKINSQNFYFCSLSLISSQRVNFFSPLIVLFFAKSSIEASLWSQYCLNHCREPYCQCDGAYFGKLCEYQANTAKCEQFLCENGSKCGQRGDEITCFCKPGKFQQTLIRIWLRYMLFHRVVVFKRVMTWARVDSEAYHEQIGPIPSSNWSLDIALSNAHT